ncbi:alpha-glucosidase [Propionicimonas paludicola]|uniref:Alpha-glucosidase n=1 Tax=Propionicimonas paludicola TaxID=185243 RepID=A0A2A9CV55_9ACTN|nr:glycoside hydrolase family 13 protein [Propionicimonas paludicola]PFG18026.1 alpha-glucosidase [Propionicimonas paludicola]
MSEHAADEWWRHAVVYQLYPRSFADANGDGVGDLAGIRSRLGYLAGLGVDAIWINPWYPSPMADSGYDVSDYRSIEPSFGTLDEAEALIAEAHAVGLRVLLDIVPNHTSDQHPWFVEALASAPGSAACERYLFREGRGIDGAEPPNDWRSEFGGPAWTRVIEADGRPGQWYLHLFTAAQPDLNWANPEVRAEFEDILRFWFDRGVDGFRIDVAHGLVKDPGFADLDGMTFPLPEDAPDGLEHPHWDQPGIHEIFRGWRRVADSYSPPRAFCGEIWVGRDRRLAAYLRPDELHTAFNFSFLVSPWLPDQLRQRISSTLAAHAAVGAPPTWVLGNHDVCRPASRYAREQRVHAFEDRTLSHFLDRPADRERGLRRARAAALLSLALPGSAYLFNGEELGLPEVEDLPLEALQDPVVRGTDFADRGRDGCRVPLPWTISGTNYGFSPEGGAAGWLPQPAGWGEHSVQAQDGRPGSTLELYRSALALRRTWGLGVGEFGWLEAGPQAVAFTCGADVECWVNLGEQPLSLPDAARVLLTSDDLVDGRLAPDAAAWLLR